MNEPRPRRRRAILTDKMVCELKRRAVPYVYGDPELGGHAIRIQPHGPPHGYYVIRRDAFGKQRWIKLGSTAELKIEDSREKARTVIRRLKEGLEPFETPPVRPDTVADVVATYFKRYVEPRGLRSAAEKRRILERHVLPIWGERPFTAIGRADIARLCDAVEDAHGPWVADTVLTELSSIARWYASRHDTYQPPFVQRMRRVGADQRKRSRLLLDDEIRSIWLTAENAGTYGAFLRVALLSGQRREKVTAMKWKDISPDGVWHIPSGPREKGTAGQLQLPTLALSIIKAQPRFASSPYVFAGRSNGPIRNFSEHKANFDKRLPPMPPWTVHDLRRCARSLMARAHVQRDVAEAVLGHQLRGVEGIYDVYHREPEKAAALAKLAFLIENIVHGTPDGNVLPMWAPAAAQP